MPNACQQFKRTLEELHAPLSKAQSLLQEYAQSGEEEKFQEMVSKVEEYERRFEEFKREYFEEVKRLLGEWYPDDIQDARKKFFYHIILKDDGMLDLQEDPQLEDTDITHFPFLIQNVHRSLTLQETSVTSTNSLSEVKERLDCYFCESLTTLPELIRVGGDLSLHATVITSAPKLKEIGGALFLRKTAIHTATEFLGVFPSLKKIGTSSQTNHSVFLSKDQVELGNELLRLKQEGTLDLAGSIAIDEVGILE